MEEKEKIKEIKEKLERYDYTINNQEVYKQKEKELLKRFNEILEAEKYDRKLTTRINAIKEIFQNKLGYEFNNGLIRLNNKFKAVEGFFKVQQLMKENEEKLLEAQKEFEKVKNDDSLNVSYKSGLLYKYGVKINEYTSEKEELEADFTKARGIIKSNFISNDINQVKEELKKSVVDFNDLCKGLNLDYEQWQVLYEHNNKMLNDVDYFWNYENNKKAYEDLCNQYGIIKNSNQKDKEMKIPTGTDNPEDNPNEDAKKENEEQNDVSLPNAEQPNEHQVLKNEIEEFQKNAKLPFSSEDKAMLQSIRAKVLDENRPLTNSERTDLINTINYLDYENGKTKPESNAGYNDMQQDVPSQTQDGGPIKVVSRNVWKWVKEHKKEILIALGLIALTIAVIVALQALIPAITAAINASQVSALSTAMVTNGNLWGSATVAEQVALHGGNTALAPFIQSLTGASAFYTPATGVWTIGGVELGQFASIAAAKAAAASAKVAALSATVVVTSIGGIGLLGAGLLSKSKNQNQFSQNNQPGQNNNNYNETIPAQEVESRDVDNDPTKEVQETFETINNRIIAIEGSVSKPLDQDDIKELEALKEIIINGSTLNDFERNDLLNRINYIYYINNNLDNDEPANERTI